MCIWCCKMTERETTRCIDRGSERPYQEGPSRLCRANKSLPVRMENVFERDGFAYKGLKGALGCLTNGNSLEFRMGGGVQ